MTKILLKESIETLGNPGDIVNVSAGYARNYLLPQQKAVLATPENIRNIESYKKLILKKAAETKMQFQGLAEKIGALTCTLKKRAGTNNKLFGSVTNQELSNFLNSKGIKIDKRMIQMDAVIKTTGEFEVKIKLHPEVKATLKVIVEISTQ